MNAANPPDGPAEPPAPAPRRRFDLYPAIDLRGGRCVRLLHGDYGAETVYGDDPVAQAQRFAAAGARWIHVVDLDAARTGDPVNLQTIRALCAAVPGVAVQTGGGVRSVAAAEERLDAGAARVVVGSAAVTDPALVESLAARHPGRVAVGLDCRGREVAIHGWVEPTGHDVTELARRFADPRVGAVVVTQIDVDGALTGPDVDLYAELLATVDAPLLASGGVGSVADVRALAGLEVSGRRLAGAIAGRAIYEGRLTVEEGVAACSPPA
jgi:phosphoribosylformimino-5-aminoimidazole carboxamide ribotide isomerase